jgi:hypothetical protein
MLDYSIIRDYYKNADRINTEHLIIAEWNMNKYVPIKQYGLYKGYPGSSIINESVPLIYQEGDASILSGENYLVYDDGSKAVDPSQEYFSDLASVFKPNRPDPGIILLQKFGNMTFATSAGSLKTGLISTNKPRYYPVSENRPYDYFNSAKLIDLDPLSFAGQDFDRYSRVRYGISDSRTGKIANANPFVVYEGDPVFCNKISIKVQNHLSVPNKFEIETLVSGSWQPVYALASSSSADFATGVLNIYFDGSSWTKTEAYINDINELNLEDPSEFKKINGVRLKVQQMTLVKSNQAGTELSPASLELIEISPRLQINISDYTESFNFASSIGDSTNFGLPVGSIVSGTGNIVLSNEDNQFLISSILGSLKMLNEDVKFNFYQKVTVDSNNETYTIPMKVLYSNQWNVGQDYSVSVDLEDGMKYLRQINAPDIIFSSNVPMSTLILLLMDNVGITGLEFKKSSDAAVHDKEDIRIKNFFCKKEQTMAEVLEQITIATQCSMFYDAVGKFNVLTKERLSENASIVQSIGPSASVQQTDFWFIGDEDYDAESDPEYPYTASYTANIASLSETKINPITDGDIVYHTYGPKKDPLIQSIQLDKEKTSILDKLKIDQIPMSSLAFSNYGYSSTILWEPTQDNDAVLGAANVTRDVTSNRLANIFTASYSAVDEDNLIRQLYLLTSGNDSHRRSLVIYLDVNEGITIDPYEGIILIDNEYIKYRGKLFYVASTNPIFSGYRIIFNRNEFEQVVANIQKGDSISFRGVIVDVQTKIVDKDNNKYWYRVIGDGRAHFSSKASQHFALAEDSDGIEENKRFKLMLGGTKTEAINMPGNLTATTKFNFLDKIRYKSARKILGTIPPESLNSYLGFLHIYGPKSPAADTDILLSILDASKSKTVPKRLQDMNDQVDRAVPGNFDNYVYMQGERNIYGQKITLDFSPNAISTRMRLYSPRRLVRNNQEIMSTNSSIAGIGFGINSNNEGYFLEVESAGSGKDVVEKEAFLNNLRFYKVQLKSQENGKNVYEPKLLLRESVGGFTVFDTSLQIIKNDDVPLDPVFDLDILIKKYANGIQYTIYYGGTKIGTYVEPIGEAIMVDGQNICLFVRNDSQAIYEYVMAAARPYGGVVTNNNERDYFRNYKHFNRQLEKGIIPVNKNFVFQDNNKGIQFYFNDFARLAREVKEYDVRFAVPAYTSALLDISKINPKYFIKNYKPTAFGAKLTIVNSSGGPISLGEGDNLPLFIIGIAAQEIHSGTVTMKEIYDTTEDDKKRQTDREKNIAIYGSQTFNLDSQYIQSISQAKNLMRWITRYCGRQRTKLSLEVFSNPLIELGDKVKVFDKSRGFNMSKKEFGSKTFVVSSISHSVSPGGPSMTVDLVEVGES